MGVRVARGDDALERRLAAERTAALLEVRLELVAPMLQVALHRVDRKVAERAERAAEDTLADVREQVDVAGRRGTVLDSLEELQHPARSLAARRALAARFVQVELRRPDRELHHATAVVDDDQRRGAEERPEGCERVVVERRVELLRYQRRYRRAAGDHGLELAPVRNPARPIVDQLAHRRAEVELVVPGSYDVARDREDGGSGSARDAGLHELRRAQRDDRRDRRDRADVVDLRRRRIETLHGWERRPRPRLAALALERVQERCLLTADVRTGAAVHDDADFAEQSCLARLVDGAREDLVLGQVLAADVDEDVVRFDRARGDQRPLD